MTIAHGTFCNSTGTREEWNSITTPIDRGLMCVSIENEQIVDIRCGTGTKLWNQLPSLIAPHQLGGNLTTPYGAIFYNIFNSTFDTSQLPTPLLSLLYNGHVVRDSMPINEPHTLEIQTYSELFDVVFATSQYIPKTEWDTKYAADGVCGHFWWDEGSLTFGTPVWPDLVVGDMSFHAYMRVANTDVANASGASAAYAPQSIVKAPLGARPDGWSSADCDAPVCSILADRILPHSTYYGQSGIVSASGAYDSTHVAWRGVTGTVLNDDDAWVSAIDTGISVAAPAWFRYDLHTARSLGSTVTLIARSFVSDVANPKTFEIRGVRDDGSEDVIGSYTNQPLATPRQQLTYAITPLAPYKAVYLHITGSNALRAAAIGDFQISFADATNGHVGIPAGLQVAYVDSGQVRLSTELVSPIMVDMTDKDNGTHHVCVECAEDGAILNVGISGSAPQVGYERVDPALPPSGINVGNMTLSGGLAAAFDGNVDQSAASSAAAGSSALGGYVGNDFGSPQALKYAIAYSSNNSGFWNGATTGKVQLWGSNSNDFTTATLISSVSIANTLSQRVVTLNADSSNYRYRWVQALPDNTVLSTYIAEIEWYVESQADVYNPTSVTMLDSANAPIRRVYLGSVIKSGGSIVAVNCYALGTKVRVPVNSGSNAVGNTTYSLANPFGYDGVNVSAKYKKDSEWRPHPTIYYYGTTGYGRRHGKLDHVKYEWAYKDYLDTDALGNVNDVPVVIIFERGY